MRFIQSLHSWFKNKTIILLITFNSFFLNSIAYASYNIDKVRITLSSQQLIDTVKLSNVARDMPVDLQIQVFRWTQNNGNDVYQNTKDLIIAPPQLKIPIGKSQLVRVGWRNPMPLTQELAYRMIITDLTPYTQPKNSVLIRLRINLPIFIEPSDPTLHMGWQLKKINGNQIRVIATNTGNVHVEVTKLTLTNSNSEVIASQPTQFYLLPNQSKEGVLTLNKSPGSSVTVTAETDGGTQKATVNVL